MAKDDSSGGGPKPAGRLQTAEDVRAAIAALLRRLRERRGKRHAAAETAWPEDLNAPPRGGDRPEVGARG